MGEKDNNQPNQQENDVTNKAGEQKKKKTSDKLRQKLEKLKKDDPNIYPVF